MLWQQDMTIAVDSGSDRTWKFDWDDDGSGPGTGLLNGSSTILTSSVTVDLPALVVQTENDTTTVTAKIDFTGCEVGSVVTAVCGITFDSAIGGLTDSAEVEVNFYVES